MTEELGSAGVAPLEARTASGDGLEALVAAMSTEREVRDRRESFILRRRLMESEVELFEMEDGKRREDEEARIQSLKSSGFYRRFESH